MSTRDRSAHILRRLTLGCAFAALGVAGAASPLAAQNPPRHNSQTQRAEQRLALARVQEGENAQRSYIEALQLALQGIQADENNANGWFIAGQAYRSLNDFVAADSMFDRALELYPGFAPDIEIEREIGWAEEYNRGAEAYNENRLEDAIRHFENAGIIYDKYPDHLMILGYLYVEFDRIEDAANAYLQAMEIFERGIPESVAEDPALAEDWYENRSTAFLEAGRILEYLGRPQEAAEAYRRLLALDENALDAKVRLATVLSGLGQAAEAEALLAEIGNQSALDEEQQFSLGVGFYQAERYDLAADAFAQAFAANPMSRDAGYNTAQSLFMLSQAQGQALLEAPPEEAAARTAELVATLERMRDVAERTRELDPYNRDLLFLLTRAYQGLAQNTDDVNLANEYTEKLVAIIDEHDAMPFEISGISVVTRGNDLTVSGRLENLKLDPGATAQLRFILVGRGGAEVGSSVVSVTAPAQGEAVEFSVDLSSTDEVLGWRYEVVQ